MREAFAPKGRGFRHPEGVTPYLRTEGASRAAGAEGLHPEDAEGFTAPEGRGSLRLHRSAAFIARPQLCLRRHHLFSRKRKDGGEKSAWGREIALRRRKTSRYTLRIIVTPVVQERPDGRP